MPKYSYEVPSQFLLLHHITMSVGDYDFIQIVLGGRAKASATNGSVAGVISQTLAAGDALKPVVTIYVCAKEASRALKRTKTTPLVFELLSKDKGKLVDGTGKQIPFSWEPGDLKEPSLDIDAIFPDPESENLQPKQYFQMPFYALNGMVKVLEGLNVQTFNMLFCGDKDPSVSHYTSYCEKAGEVNSSFVSVVE
mgnify:CR=1 FL=1